VNECDDNDDKVNEKQRKLKSENEILTWQMMAKIEKNCED
jgi:hypothetical protein